MRSFWAIFIWISEFIGQHRTDLGNIFGKKIPRIIDIPEIIEKNKAKADSLQNNSESRNQQMETQNEKIWLKKIGLKQKKKNQRNHALKNDKTFEPLYRMKNNIKNLITKVE